MLERSILTVELFRLCSSKFRNLLCRGGPHLWNECVPKIIINDTIMFFLNCNQHFPMQVAIFTIFTFILGNTSKKSAQRGFGFGIEFRRVEKS